MAKKQFPKLLIIVGVAIGVIIPVWLFVPFSLFFPATDVQLQEILDDANKIIKENRTIALEIDFCTDASMCPEVVSVINRTVIENILDPLPEGEIVINETLPEPTPIELPAPEPEIISMEVISNVVKVDNTGKRTESKTNVGTPLLAFFAEDTTNINFDNGILEQTLMIKTKPDIEVTANGKFDVVIGKQSILGTPITIATQGTTDSNGELSLNYKPSPNISSKEYLFYFRDHIAKFNTTGITKVELILLEITVDANNQKFALSNSTVFSMDIARDPIQLLITKENGVITRVYPTDDSLVISSTAGSYTTSVYGCTGYQKYYTCYGSYGYISYSNPLPTPAMGGGKVFNIKPDGTSQVVDAFASSLAGTPTTKLNIKLTRDEIYKIDFDSPKASITFKTPKDKAVSYSFYCTNKGTSATAFTIYCNYNDIAVIDPLKASLGQ